MEKKLNELNEPRKVLKTPEEKLKFIEAFNDRMVELRKKMETDPMIIAARKEYEIRKANGEFDNEVK